MVKRADRVVRRDDRLGHLELAREQGLALELLPAARGRRPAQAIRLSPR